MTASSLFISDHPTDDGNFLYYIEREFQVLLRDAGISSHKITTVFNENPPGGDLLNWTSPKKGLPRDYTLGPLFSGKYLSPEFFPKLRNLHSIIEFQKPSLIVALGGVALWALANTSAIKSHRGAVLSTRFGPVLPTLHPKVLGPAWADRIFLAADFKKALRLSETSNPAARKSRRILIAPTLAELESFDREFLAPASTYSIDVETKLGQITCVGFSPSPDVGAVIPFWDSAKESGSFWETLAEERAAKNLVRKWLARPALKLFQNGLYDMQYFLKERMPIRNAHLDTMLLQHAKFPELPKSLGFLGSIHTDEPAWKLMRDKADTVKRDE